ncbi:unnamed protein product [Effrenium voratum]|nr:unnamed protein product [Effrenium voratum]
MDGNDLCFEPGVRIVPECRRQRGEKRGWLPGRLKKSLAKQARSVCGQRDAFWEAAWERRCEEREKDLDLLEDEVDALKERTAKTKDLLRQHVRLQEAIGLCPTTTSQRIKRLAEATAVSESCSAAGKNAGRLVSARSLNRHRRYGCPFWPSAQARRREEAHSEKQGTRRS